jgi:hypothetical protein
MMMVVTEMAVALHLIQTIRQDGARCQISHLFKPQAIAGAVDHGFSATPVPSAGSGAFSLCSNSITCW